MSSHMAVMAKRYKIARLVTAAVSHRDNVMYFELAVVNRKLYAEFIPESVYLAAIVASELIAVEYSHCISTAPPIPDSNVVKIS